MATVKVAAYNEEAKQAARFIAQRSTRAIRDSYWYSVLFRDGQPVDVYYNTMSKFSSHRGAEARGWAVGSYMVLRGREVRALA